MDIPADLSNKIQVANACLATFSTSTIERRRGGWYVCWGDKARRCQILKGNDFYPIWHNRWPGGGTARTAISQLIRWLRGQPVLPISTWYYWASDGILLLPESAVETLQKGGYPKNVRCVLCDHWLLSNLNWWSLDGVSGPCCHWTQGCSRQERNIQATTIDAESW